MSHRVAFCREGGGGRASPELWPGGAQRRDLGRVWVPMLLQLVWLNNPVRDINDSG